jgi:probable HAF family extracellular repeat protein
VSTLPWAINKSGTIVGGFSDSHEGVYHGFLRTADGVFTPFDVAGSFSTTITAINDKGAIAGIYQEKDDFSPYLVFAGKP